MKVLEVPHHARTFTSQLCRTCTAFIESHHAHEGWPSAHMVQAACINCRVAPFIPAKEQKSRLLQLGPKNSSNLLVYKLHASIQIIHYLLPNSVVLQYVAVALVPAAMGNSMEFTICKQNQYKSNFDIDA